MDLYAFNPDADMALAYWGENYLPPASIRKMAEDLSLLPLWYAPSGSGVLAPSAYNLDYLKRMSALFPLSVRLVTEPELSGLEEVRLHPWGWNPSYRRKMLKAGVAVEKLPDLELLRRWRDVAGRHVALQVLAAFEGWEHCCGAGICLYTLSECERYARQKEGCVFKAPWSGSGKGLAWCYGGFHSSLSGWCRRVLDEQGFVVGMPIYNKVFDFAMEFEADGRGGIRFAGYSLFETNAKGAYARNHLVSDEYVEQKVAHCLPLTTLWNIRDRLQTQLADSCGDYAGCLGVDMMVCRTENASRYALFPCVEVNLRMNMGMLSRLFFNRFMLPSARGVFVVEAFSTSAELHSAHKEDEKAFPLQVQEGKLVSGYLPLVPVAPKSRYRAYVRVAE